MVSVRRKSRERKIVRESKRERVWRERARPLFWLRSHPFFHAMIAFGSPLSVSFEGSCRIAMTRRFFCLMLIKCWYFYPAFHKALTFTYSVQLSAMVI